MLKEFKDFAFKGNLVDMAVGIIIGGAFGTVVKSLVDNVFMPPLGAVTSGIDFAKLKHIIQPGVDEVKDGDKVITEAVPEVALNYGQFINDLIAFVILAFVVFLVIKKFMGAMKKEEEAAPPEPPKQEVLLEEIRDLLKKA